MISFLLLDATQWLPQYDPCQPESGENRYFMYVKELSQLVSNFQLKVEKVLDLNQGIEVALKNLETCVFERSTLESYLDECQQKARV